MVFQSIPKLLKKYPNEKFEIDSTIWLVYIPNDKDNIIPFVD